MFCPPRWSSLCGWSFKKGLLVRCCWKTLNSNSLDCFCAFTVSVIWSRKSLPGNFFPEFSSSYTYWLKWELAYFAMSSGRTHLNWSSWFKMENLFRGCWFYILSDLWLSLLCVRKLRVFFRRFLFFLLLRFSSLLELDEEELLLEEVEVELLLLFCFLLFILPTFLRFYSRCLFLVY